MQAVKKYIAIVILLLIVSCSASNRLVRKRFTFYNDLYKEKFIIDLPKGFIDEFVIIGHGREYNYIYKDSSLIYISNENSGASPNYENIKFRYILQQLIAKDTALYEGVDSVGLYWKEIRYPTCLVGYKDVHQNAKSLYDKAINSFCKK